MDLLARREHSTGELRRKLLNRGHDRQEVDAVLEALHADRLLDDAHFMESYVRVRAQRGFGPLRIRGELRERDVDDIMIEGFLDINGEEWQHNAALAREKRYGPGMPVDARERARQMRFLQQRGFTTGQVSKLFRQN